MSAVLLALEGANVSNPDFANVARWRRQLARKAVLREERTGERADVNQLAHEWDRPVEWVRALGGRPVARSVPPAPEPRTSIRGRLDATEAEVARAIQRRLAGTDQGEGQ